MLHSLLAVSLFLVTVQGAPIDTKPKVMLKENQMVGESGSVEIWRVWEIIVKDNNQKRYSSDYVLHLEVSDLDYKIGEEDFDDPYESKWWDFESKYYREMKSSFGEPIQKPVLEIKPRLVLSELSWSSGKPFDDVFINGVKVDACSTPFSELYGSWDRCSSEQIPFEVIENNVLNAEDIIVTFVDDGTEVNFRLDTKWISEYLDRSKKSAVDELDDALNDFELSRGDAYDSARYYYLIVYPIYFLGFIVLLYLSYRVLQALKYKFNFKVNKLVKKFKNRRLVTNKSSDSKKSRADELLTWAELRECGAISDEEFEREKARLMN